MFILASSSPRRKILLKKIISNFEIVTPLIDEESISCDNIFELPILLSKLKAESIYNLYPTATILACDTVVILDNEILGKPKNNIDAINTLKKLSGKMHKVVSGYTIIKGNIAISRGVTTNVYMNELSDDLIKEYVEKGLSNGKAGSYGIQDEDFKLVNKIEGSYDNVVGLPTEDILKIIHQKFDDIL